VKIQARSVPPTDKLLRDVRAAKQSDMARGTGPRNSTPKSFHEVPDVAPTPETTPDLHSALNSVGGPVRFNVASSTISTGSAPPG
jgi:hypothetical protein